MKHVKKHLQLKYNSHSQREREKEAPMSTAISRILITDFQSI